MKKHLKPYTNILCKILFYELVEWQDYVYRLKKSIKNKKIN